MPREGKRDPGKLKLINPANGLFKLPAVSLLWMWVDLRCLTAAHDPILRSILPEENSINEQQSSAVPIQLDVTAAVSTFWQVDTKPKKEICHYKSTECCPVSSLDSLTQKSEDLFCTGEYMWGQQTACADLVLRPEANGSWHLNVIRDQTIKYFFLISWYHLHIAWYNAYVKGKRWTCSHLIIISGHDRPWRAQVP